MKISTVEEMRSLDEKAVSVYGIPEEILMENAGQAAYTAILDEFGVEGKKFAVFCGSGNNGGDGLVVARKLYSSGGNVKVVLLGDISKFRGAGRKNMEIVNKSNIDIVKAWEISSINELMKDCDVLIDAIFGTGLDRPIDGLHREIINGINSSGKKVFSLDIPSGINGDTGQVMGTAVKANFTVTFGLPKIGNIVHPGFDHSGKIYISHISFPPELYRSEDIKISTSEPSVLPLRKSDTHKGDFGKTLFIAGSSNYMGAPYLAAMSFLKAGGGLSYLATPESVAPFIGIKGAEIVLIPQKQTISGSLSLKNEEELLELSEKVDFVVIGPGLSLDDETKKLVRNIVWRIRKPLLVDGDGLTAVSEDPIVLKKRDFPTILTPHGGEIARLAAIELDYVSKNKIQTLRRLTEELNSSIVLKGAHSLIGFPDGRIFVNLSGNPGMATAGSGDVLTGIISAMFCLGFDIEDSLRTGVFAHGYAGDLAAKIIGEDGIVASDIMENLPIGLKYLREDYTSVTRDCYGKFKLL